MRTPAAPYPAIGAWLRRLRERNALSLADAAAALSIDPAELRQYESGLLLASGTVHTAIAWLYDLPIRMGDCPSCGRFRWLPEGQTPPDWRCAECLEAGRSGDDG